MFAGYILTPTETSPHSSYVCYLCSTYPCKFVNDTDLTTVITLGAQHNTPLTISWNYLEGIPITGRVLFHEYFDRILWYPLAQKKYRSNMVEMQHTLRIWFAKVCLRN